MSSEKRSSYRLSTVHALLSGAVPSDIIVAGPKRPLQRILQEEAYRAKLKADKEGKKLWGQIVLTDAGSQNAINQIAGEAAGDQNLNAYWDLVSRALGTITKNVERNNRLRVSEDQVEMHFVSTIRKARSDEGKLIILASSKTDDKIIEELTKTEGRMRDALRILRKIVYGQRLGRDDLERIESDEVARLEDYEFRIRTEMGEAYSDLRRLGKMMRHIETLAAVTFECGDPFKVDEDLGVVERNIAIVESGEIQFRDRVPTRLRIFRTMGAVETPFAQKLDELEAFGSERIVNEGNYVQIRFQIPDEDAEELKKYIFDGWNGEDSKGTRKGHAELYGQDNKRKKSLGMRGLNTFLGKDSSDTLISIAARAVKKVSDELEISIFPVGNNLRYHIPEKEGLSQKEIAAKIKEAVDKEIKAYSRDLEFEAQVDIFASKEAKIGKISAYFELMNLGRVEEGIEILERANLIVSVIEKIKPEIILEVLEGVIFDTNERDEVKNTLEKLRRIFENRRTVRDASDLISLIRNDAQLQIAENQETGWRENLENEFFRLVKQYGEAISNEIRRRIASED